MSSDDQFADLNNETAFRHDLGSIELQFARWASDLFCASDIEKECETFTTGFNKEVFVSIFQDKECAWPGLSYNRFGTTSHAFLLMKILSSMCDQARLESAHCTFEKMLGVSVHQYGRYINEEEHWVNKYTCWGLCKDCFDRKQHSKLMCGIPPVEYTEPDDGMICLCSLIGSVAFVVERISVATFSPFVLIELAASLCLILKLPIDTRIGTEQWKYCMLPSPIIGKIPNLIVESGDQKDDPYFMYTLPETNIAPQK